MSDLLSIGASGVNAYRTALSAIGDNVANAETAGYARRTVTIGEQPTTASAGLGYSSGLNFGGSNALSVARAWNDYQAAASRSAIADAGRADARDRWMSATETALGDSSDGTSVGVKLTSVYTAADALAGNPSSTSSRSAFLSAIGDAAQAFNTTAQGLANVAQGIGTEARTAVTSVNAGLDQLEQVNAAIVRSQPGSSAAASLMDQRDQLIDTISGNVDVSVTLDSRGVASLTLASNSAVVLTGTGRMRLSLGQSADGRLSLSALGQNNSIAMSAPGGALAGLVESSSSVADKRAQLDAIAASFAGSINSWSAAGTDANGAAGAPLLSGSTAGTVALATTDPAKVPAAKGSVSNGNLLDLATVRTSDNSESRWAALVTDQAQITAAASTESTSAAALKDAALSSRDGTSGVDLDTEAANLLRFQQAYSGAAKIIQVARETLQSILEIV